jgi:translation initiation factor IF-3
LIDNRKPSPNSSPKLKINGFIRAKEVRVIGGDGTQLGILSVRDAQMKADEAALDLVEVAPTANPPVCRIMDFGKYKYEQSKKEQGGKTHATHLKEVQLRPFTCAHDLEFKIRHAKEFLEAKHKVRIALLFRGREMMFYEKGRETMGRIEQMLVEVGQLESPLKKEGRNLVMIVTPKSHGAQKKVKEEKNEAKT